MKMRLRVLGTHPRRRKPAFIIKLIMEAMCVCVWKDSAALLL
jgi:hypothetical protein